MALEAQISSVNLRLVFRFPLGPLPWCLAEPIETLKKTSKAALLHNLEGKVELTENVSAVYVMIVDGMVYVQQAPNKIFDHLAMDYWTEHH